MWLRALVVALLAAGAALTVLPNVAVVLQPCLYRDSRGSVVRWASVARQGLAFAFVAAKCTEVRACASGLQLAVLSRHRACVCVTWTNAEGQAAPQEHEQELPSCVCVSSGLSVLL